MSAVLRQRLLADRSSKRNIPPGWVAAARNGRRRVYGVVGIMAAILAAGTTSGCVGDGPSSEASSGCIGPGITDDSLRLGVISSQTGVSGATYLPFRSGVDARLGAQNAIGGVHDRTLVSDWRDDESSPDANAAVARQLVRDAAFAVLEGSTASAGSADYLREQGVPVSGPATDQAWTDHANMVSYGNAFTGPSVTTWGDFVHDRQGSRAAVVSIESLPSSIQLAERTVSSLHARGVQVPIHTQIPIIDPDLETLAERMRDQDVDTLVVSIDGPLLPAVISAAADAGVRPKVVLVPAGYNQGLLSEYGKALVGGYFFVDFRPFESASPSHQQFLGAMSRFAPQTQPATQPAAVSGWIAADMMIQGLIAAGSCPTRATTLIGMRASRGYDAGGLLLDPVNLADTQTKTQACFAVVQVNPEGAAFVPAEAQPRCGEVLKPAS